MLTVIFDAGPLITACKFEARGQLIIDHLLAGCRVVITDSVEEEVAILGAHYPDGVAAGERIARGDIQVSSVVKRKWTQHLADYALGSGERDSIELWKEIEGEKALIIDDNLAFIVASRLEITVWMLPDLVTRLAVRETLTVETTEAILKAVRPRYRIGVIEHSQVHLQEIENAQSRGTSE